MTYDQQKDRDGDGDWFSDLVAEPTILDKNFWHWRLVTEIQRVSWTAFAILAKFHYNECTWLSVAYLAVCPDSNCDCLKERNNWSEKLAFYHNVHRNKKSRHLAAMEEYGNETLPKGFWIQELLCKYWNWNCLILQWISWPKLWNWS